MKKAKNLLLISVGVIILGMSILYSCKNYTGPSNGQGLFADKEKANNVDSGEDSAGTQMLTPDSQRVVVWNDTQSCIIPALTVMKDNILIAAVGSKTKGKLLIKESKDNGKNWTEVNAPSIGTDLNDSYVHPFFINCHNGDILLGVSTTNASQNSLYLYRSVDGKNWTSEFTNITMNSMTNTNVVVTNKNKIVTTNNVKTETGSLELNHTFVTYGNGITLRHKNNAGKNKLLFPYYYKTPIKDNTLHQGSIATMISTDDGKNWKRLGYDQGPYVSYGAKFIELNDGNILYFMNDAAKRVAWFESTNCGETSKCITVFTKGAHNEDRIQYADFARYEFDGRDIKGAEYALMVFSTDKTSYSVKMTTDDFNKGKDNKSGAYLGGGSKVIAANLTKPSAIYPTITVLKDGTIATLAAEDDGMVFRRFELNWFLEDELWMEQ